MQRALTLFPEAEGCFVKYRKADTINLFVPARDLRFFGWVCSGERNMSKGQSLQDPFLNALRRERIPVAIYLVNGIKLQGTVESFDQFVVLLRNQVSQMVYKHAISTVVPSRNVQIDNNQDERSATSPDDVLADSGT